MELQTCTFARSRRVPTASNGVILNGLQAMKDLARTIRLQPLHHIRSTPDASQAQHDAILGVNSLPTPEVRRLRSAPSLLQDRIVSILHQLAASVLGVLDV
jgi:hypothetical protein